MFVAGYCAEQLTNGFLHYLKYTTYEENGDLCVFQWVFVCLEVCPFLYLSLFHCIITGDDWTNTKEPSNTCNTTSLSLSVSVEVHMRSLRYQ